MTRVTALIRQALYTHPTVAPSAPLFAFSSFRYPAFSSFRNRPSFAFSSFRYPAFSSFRNRPSFAFSSFRAPALRVIRSKSTKVQGGIRCESKSGSEYIQWRSGGGTVHFQAELHSSVIVEHGALVESKAQVGANTRISAGCIVGPSVTIGESTTLAYNVVLQNCSIGSSCSLHPGVCVGQDGFGFLEGTNGEIVKKPQLLRVQIGNHVEIGANTCIDRGSWRDTLIGDYTKIDNLVQIGHNVVIGRGCMLCGQVGIAGSATLGDYVVLGGKAGVSDHVTVVSRVRIAAKSGVMSNIDKPGDYAGFPAVPIREWRRQMVGLRRLGRPAAALKAEVAVVEDH